MTVMETGDTVAIAGAGMTGMEAAFSLAKKGKKVTRIDMLKRNELGAGATKMQLQAGDALERNEDCS